MDELFKGWLRHIGTFSTSLKAPRPVQHIAMVQRVVDLLQDGQLSVDKDRGHIERFLDWVGTWKIDRKTHLVKTLQFAANHHPCPGLWERVCVEGSVIVDGKDRGRP